jgi:hypothetical protein
MEPTLKGRRIIMDLSSQGIDEISGRKESFIPVCQWHTSMSEQRQPNFNNILMFSFSRPILLMGIRTQDMTRDIDAFKEGIQFLVLTP